MVCPVCIIPLVTGATSLGTFGKIWNSWKETWNDKNKRKKIYVLGFFLLLMLSLTIFFIVYKKQLAQKCDTCKIALEEEEKK